LIIKFLPSSERAPPPTQFQFSPAAQTKFVICDCTIEFNFRDAKQFWGLEDFMNVNQIPVYNAANLAMFMVNLSQAMIRSFQPTYPTFSVTDLKAHFRGRKYVSETLKLLPQIPEPIFIDRIFANIAQIGSINAP